MTEATLEYRVGHREKPGDTAIRLIKQFATQTNDRLGGNMLDWEGRLRLDQFTSGDDYDPDEVIHDMDHCRRKELLHTGLDVASVREFKIKQQGINTAGLTESQLTEQLLEKEQLNRYKHQGSQAEVVIPLIMQRALGDRFVIVRTSTYDDYEAGVDHLIIDRESGQVICGIDEVLSEAATGKEKFKIERAEKKAQRGGTTIRYGLTFDNGQLVKKELDHLLTMILPISTTDLAASLQELGQNVPAAACRRIYDSLRTALSEQLQHLGTLNLSPAMNQKVTEFKTLLKQFPSATAT
ncbi:MAG: hypothetical protein V1846_04670 [Candidatus Komeilibacteria bacterium]